MAKLSQGKIVENPGFRAKLNIWTFKLSPILLVTSPKIKVSDSNAT